MTFKFDVTKDKLKALTPTEGVTGNVNFYVCEFSFSEHWGDLSKFAVFVGDESINVNIDDGICLVPWEVLESEGEIFIGVFGTNGKDELKRISTNLLPFTLDTGAFREGSSEMKKATPEVWEENVKKVKEYCERAEDAAMQSVQIITDTKLVKTDSDQEITGVKTFSKGIVTDSIKSDNILQHKAENIEISGTECAQVSGGDSAWLYSPSGEARMGTETGNIIVSGNGDASIESRNIYIGGDKISLIGNQVFINGKEIKDTLEKEDLQFDGYSITLNEVIAKYLFLDGHDINAEEGYVAIDGEKIATEKYVDDAVAGVQIDESNLVHKTGDEEISGVKTFTDTIAALEIKATDTGDDFLISSNIDQGIKISADSHVYIDGNLDVLPGYTLFTDSIDTASGEGIAINGDVLLNGKEVATKDDIADAVGNIEEALDAAIALCDSFVGGAA